MTTSAFTIKDVEIIEDKTVFQGYYQVHAVKLRHQLFKGGWSREIKRELFVRGHSVGIILYDPAADKVVLIRQLRVGALFDSENPWLLEIVAGVIEENESPESVAIRESQEEAAAVILQLIPIGHYFVSPGGSTETVRLFCGHVDSTKIKETVQGHTGEDEDIMVYIVPREKAYELLQNGEIINAISIIAVQWLQLNLQHVKQKFQIS